MKTGFKVTNFEFYPTLQTSGMIAGCDILTERHYMLEGDDAFANATINGWLFFSESKIPITILSQLDMLPFNLYTLIINQKYKTWSAICQN